jgi:ppGpp synthetase/RelA/SpoT-type nucleotidyltranferase
VLIGADISISVTLVPMALSFLKALQAVLDRGEGDRHAEYRRRILAEYKMKRPQYEEFCIAVHKLLDLFLREGEYKHQLTYRVKLPERLHEKLVRKTEQGITYERLSDIEDLAGLRVIFYSEKEKERFIKEIKNEVGGAIRIEEKNRDSGYKATHLIVAFGPSRLKLREYRHFDGLKSEIQVTTMLRHAWAEIEHDLIYKDISGLKEQDPERFTLLRERLEEIMEKHIKKASVEFEEVMKEVAR